MSDPNTPPPKDDSEAGENTPPEEPSTAPDSASGETTPEPSPPEPAPSEMVPSEMVPSEVAPSEVAPSEVAPSEAVASEATSSEPAPEAAAGVGGPASPTSAPSADGVALGQGTLAESDEKTMSLLAHILGGVTLIIGPLIIWLIKKDESPFVNDQGKEALNFQITVLIGYVAAGVIAFLPFIGCISGILYPAICVVSLVFAILGGMEANKGIAYRYPFAARFVS